VKHARVCQFSSREATATETDPKTIMYCRRTTNALRLQSMLCPHCRIGIHRNTQTVQIFEREAGQFGGRVTISAEYQVCPECDKTIVWLVIFTREGGASFGRREESFVVPKAISRKPLPSQVLAKYADDYTEAAIVLSDSPKASAALSRRCLQHLIHDEAHIKKANLNDEIDALIASAVLPSFMNDQLHAVRVIGNFAAHPLKGTNSGEIIEVEPGEAEWTLDVLDSLFDFYFVQPALAKAKKDSINKKLTDAGKPTI